MHRETMASAVLQSVDVEWPEAKYPVTPTLEDGFGGKHNIISWRLCNTELNRTFRGPQTMMYSVDKSLQCYLPSRQRGHLQIFCFSSSSLCVYKSYYWLLINFSIFLLVFLTTSYRALKQEPSLLFVNKCCMVRRRQVQSWKVSSLIENIRPSDKIYSETAY